MLRTPGATRVFLSGPPARGLGAVGPPSPGRVAGSFGISFVTTFMVIELLIAGSKTRFSTTKDRLVASGLIAGALALVNTIALPLLTTTESPEV